MKVVCSDQVYYVGWEYQNPNMKRVLEAFDITEERAEEIMGRKIPDEHRPGKERRVGPRALIQAMENYALTAGDNKPLLEKILDKIRLGGFPRPTITKCILKNDDGQVLDYSVVKKFPSDVYDREKARSKSMNKLLRELFPNIDEENKPIAKAKRRAFWDVYCSRFEVKKDLITVHNNGVSADHLQEA